MTRLFSGPSSALNLINATVLVGGAVVAFELRNPQAFQRTGTVIAAVTGLFVVTQVLDEIRMERLLADNAMHSAERDHTLPTVDRLAVRIERNVEERKASSVRQARLTLVVLIALWLSLGEVISGFGDVAFVAVRGRHSPPIAAPTSVSAAGGKAAASTSRH
jgi:hypothetical protein